MLKLIAVECGESNAKLHAGKGMHQRNLLTHPFDKKVYTQVDPLFATDAHVPAVEIPVLTSGQTHPLQPRLITPYRDCEEEVPTDHLGISLVFLDLDLERYGERPCRPRPNLKYADQIRLDQVLKDVEQLFRGAGMEMRGGRESMLLFLEQIIPIKEPGRWGARVIPRGTVVRATFRFPLPAEAPAVTEEALEPFRNMARRVESVARRHYQPAPAEMHAV